MYEKNSSKNLWKIELPEWLLKFLKSLFKVTVFVFSLAGVIFLGLYAAGAFLAGYIFTGIGSLFLMCIFLCIMGFLMED